MSFGWIAIATTRLSPVGQAGREGIVDTVRGHIDPVAVRVHHTAFIPDHNPTHHRIINRPIVGRSCTIALVGGDTSGAVEAAQTSPFDRFRRTGGYRASTSSWNGFITCRPS